MIGRQSNRLEGQWFDLQLRLGLWTRHYWPPRAVYRRLEKAFGEEYRRYRDRVRRYWSWRGAGVR